MAVGFNPQDDFSVAGTRSFSDNVGFATTQEPSFLAGRPTLSTTTQTSPLQGVGAAGNAASLFSSVPWLGVLNLFGSGLGLYFNWKAQQKAYQDAERIRQDQLRNLAIERKFRREQFEEGKRRFDLNRKDQLEQLFKAKMDFMKWQSPGLREGLSKIAGYRAFRQAA